MSFKLFLENVDNKIQELSNALYNEGYSKERRFNGHYIKPQSSRKLEIKHDDENLSIIVLNSFDDSFVAEFGNLKDKKISEILLLIKEIE